VVTASSAEAALEKLEHVFVDVVLTDYHLGGEDGLWLLEQAQARYPRVRRVLVSGDEVANATKLIAAGALHAFVPKPIALATLLAALKVEWR
jgi:CheY-like chemotaxis protein